MFGWHHGGVSQPNVHHHPGTDARPDVRGHHLDAVIGKGGSSTVWRGTDAGGHPVAVKVPHERADPVALHQATVERHVLMAVEHDHLVGLRDVVPMDDGRVALVFDLVSGALLTGLVGRRGHLRPGEVVTVLTPLCEAVRALHVAGGSHGDISPGNVMVTEAGKPMLLDLGAARVMAAAPGVGFGTPGFVAPEVRRGAPADARSDVFSLGALAWFCATGNGAPDTDQRLDPETVTSHVGAALAGVVAECIDPDPARRPEGDRLARLFYEASRAEPVEVVLGGDDAAALTHRLREQAAAEVPDAVLVSRWQSFRQRLTRRHDTGGGLERPTTTPTGRAAPGAPGPAPEVPPAGGAPDARPGRPMWVVLVTVATVLGGVAVVTTAVASGSNPSAGSEPNLPRTTSPASPRATGPRITTTAASEGVPAQPTRPPDPRSNRKAPTTATMALVTALARDRAQALSTQDDRLLAQVHRAKSPSWTADDELIASLRRQGLRWEMLRSSVASARLVEQRGTRAVVRARVGWAAYDVVTASGTRTHRPADASAPLDLTLVWLPEGWRLEAVSDPRAS